ncbi:MAG: plasmid recombination protein [Ruminiclostridium sp.]
MPYGILRFEKRRGGPASALEKHHERKKQQYASNPDIYTEHSEMNFHLVQPKVKYYGEIQNRIEKAQKENPKCKVRKVASSSLTPSLQQVRSFLSAVQ